MAKGGHFDESKFKKFFCVFWFNLYLMWLRNTRIYYNNKTIAVLILFYLNNTFFGYE